MRFVEASWGAPALAVSQGESNGEKVAAFLRRGDCRRGRLRWGVLTSSAFGTITLKCLLALHAELPNRQLDHTSAVQGTEPGCRRKEGVICGYSEPGGRMRFTRAAPGASGVSAGR